MLPTNQMEQANFDRLTTDQVIARMLKNSDDLVQNSTSSQDVFGFDQRNLLGQNSGLREGMAGHAEDSYRLAEQLKKREEKEKTASRVFAGTLDQKLDSMIEHVEEKIVYFENELIKTRQDIGLVNGGIVVATKELADAKIETQAAARNLFREADALSMKTYEADLAKEKLKEANNMDPEQQASHVQLWADHQHKKAQERVAEAANKTELAKDKHGEALETQSELEDKLDDLNDRLTVLLENEKGLSESYNKYKAFKERLEDPEVRAQLHSGDLTIEQLEAELDNLENDTEPPSKNVEITQQAEHEEVVNLSQQGVQTKLANGDLQTGQLEADGVRADIATEMEGRDLGTNSQVTENRDGIVEVAQEIDAVQSPTSPRVATSSADAEIKALELKEPFKMAHDSVIPTQQLDVNAPAPNLTAPALG